MSHTHQDLTLLSVRSAFDHLESTIKRALQRIERQGQLTNLEVFNEIRERRKLAKILHLDKRLLAVYQALRDKPSLEIKIEENIVPASLSTGIVTLESGAQRIKFELNNKSYQIEYMQQGGGAMSFDGVLFNSGTINLYEADLRVLSVHLDLKGEQEEVSESQISAFVPGVWIYDLIHAYETLQVNNQLERIQNDYSAETISVLKERFGLTK